ncbi:MAG: hypothetical protein IKT07_11785, partial [Oscillospiraceae bacterium]|nr:hypothetical protein [Oscillospiraceae bacterium]
DQQKNSFQFFLHLSFPPSYAKTSYITWLQYYDKKSQIAIDIFQFKKNFMETSKKTNKGPLTETSFVRFS